MKEDAVKNWCAIVENADNVMINGIFSITIVDEPN